MKNASKLSQFLASPEASPKSGSIDQVLQVIRSHLGMDVAFVAEFIGDHRVFRHVDVKGRKAALKVGDRISLEEGYCQRVVDGRLPELIPDTAAVPSAMAISATRTVPIGSHLSVPIRLKDGRLYGTFCCFSYTPDHSLNERDLQMMRAFADIVAFQIEVDFQTAREYAEKVSRTRRAIEEKQISILYQPIYGLADDRVYGFECLARFAGQPIRPPNEWFADAADVDMGVELELTALSTGVKALNFLPPNISLSANISPETILSDKLLGGLNTQALDRVILEVTEHAPIADYNALRSALDPWRRGGLRLAIDDAGSGYASLRHILNLKPNLIKLDISLIKNIHEDGDKRALATALVNFGRQTHADIIAEGVECASELSVLRTLGVNHAQGYLLDRPMTLEKAIELVSSRGLSKRVRSQ